MIWGAPGSRSWRNPRQETRPQLSGWRPSTFCEMILKASWPYSLLITISASPRNLRLSFKTGKNWPRKDGWSPSGSSPPTRKPAMGTFREELLWTPKRAGTGPGRPSGWHDSLKSQTWTRPKHMCRWVNTTGTVASSSGKPPSSWRRWGATCRGMFKG